MKAVIEFNLPKEQKDYDVFISGYKFLSALIELKEFIDQSPDDFEMDREEFHYYKKMLNAFNTIINTHGIKSFL